MRCELRGSAPNSVRHLDVAPSVVAPAALDLVVVAEIPAALEDDPETLEDGPEGDMDTVVPACAPPAETRAADAGGEDEDDDDEHDQSVAVAASSTVEEVADSVVVACASAWTPADAGCHIVTVLPDHMDWSDTQLNIQQVEVSPMLLKLVHKVRPWARCSSC